MKSYTFLTILLLKNIVQNINSHILEVLNRNLTGKIVGGLTATTNQFPHLVYIDIEGCDAEAWSCGGSILNQRVLISAAHCFETCDQARITAFFGHYIAEEGFPIVVEGFKRHERFNHRVNVNDIALVLLKIPATLNKKSKRVILLRDPPYYEPAVICGWGYIDEIKQIDTDVLMYTNQSVISKEVCESLIGRIHNGMLCATNHRGTYPSMGDSGSPLIVRDTIQIGAVSFKRPDSSRTVVVYTDIAYYYDWIAENSKRAYCRSVHANNSRMSSRNTC